MEDLPLFDPEPELEAEPEAEPEPPPPPVPEHQVETLAHVFAGFRWPDRETFERLRKSQQRACRDAARTALQSLAAEPDD